MSTIPGSPLKRFWPWPTQNGAARPWAGKRIRDPGAGPAGLVPLCGYPVYNSTSINGKTDHPCLINFSHQVLMGKITYINASPVYYGLDHGMTPEWLRLVPDVPAALNHQIKNRAY